MRCAHEQKNTTLCQVADKTSASLDVYYLTMSPDIGVIVGLIIVASVFAGGLIYHYAQ